MPRDRKETRGHKEYKVRLDQQEPMALMVLTEMMAHRAHKVIQDRKDQQELTETTAPRDHKEFKVRLDQQELTEMMVQMEQMV